MRELKERDHEREQEMKEMRIREQLAMKEREKELKEEITRLRTNGGEKDARDIEDKNAVIWAEDDGSMSDTICKLAGSGVDPVLELCALLNLDSPLRNEKTGMVTVYELFNAGSVKALMEKFEVVAAGSSRSGICSATIRWCVPCSEAFESANEQNDISPCSASIGRWN